MAGIQPAKNSNFQVVHSYIMKKYEINNPGLRKQTGNNPAYNKAVVLDLPVIARNVPAMLFTEHTWS